MIIKVLYSVGRTEIKCAYKTLKKYLLEAWSSQGLRMYGVRSNSGRNVKIGRCEKKKKKTKKKALGMALSDARSYRLRPIVP